MEGPTRMKPKDAFYKVGTGIHRAVFNASKGRIFGNAFGMNNHRKERELKRSIPTRTSL